MIWFVIIIATAAGIVTGFLTRSLRRALLVGLITLALGVLAALVIVNSGLMDG